MTHSTAELVEHARKLRADLNDTLPNGVGNTIDALADRLQQQDRLREALERIAAMTDIEADFDGFEAREIASRALTQSGNE